MHVLATNPEFDSLQGLLAWMHSYLDACCRYLKKCMLYLSIFSQDIIIRRRRLIRRWIAKGYSKGNDNISMEKYAEKIFKEVAALSIMQPVLEASKVIGYQVNGMFREYILSRPVEERIFFPVEVSTLEKQGQGRLTTEGIGQHLAIGWDIDQIMLRVLDLENARGVVNSDFEKIGKLPSCLKFLSLRGHSNITRPPDSVGDLVHLQTLDIRGTKIRTLPAFITKLRKLQYIRAGTAIAWTDDGISSSDGAEQGSTPSSCSSSRTLPFCLPKKFLRRGGPAVGSRSGVDVPTGIKGLNALQTLGVVHINTADGEAILDEISFKLSQLKKLEVSGIMRKQGGGSLWLLCAYMSRLKSFSLQLEWNNHFVGWENLRIPKSLQSLKMIGHVDKLPWTIHSAINLEKLTLEMTNALLKAEVKQQLGELPSLHTLRLRVSKDVQDGELRFQTTLFSKLQVLEIACKSKLNVSFDDGAMDKLEQLMVHCLRGSEMQFSGLQYQLSLKQVWLLGFFHDTLKAALQQQLDMHQKIPAPKLEVQRG